jgi:FixJ family two-component response regulator
VLKKSGTESAVVFMTGHGDVLTGVKAMKGRAVDFLLKPFSDEELLDAVGRAIVRDGNLRATQMEGEGTHVPCLAAHASRARGVLPGGVRPR